jgi:hypothetical protein
MLRMRRHSPASHENDDTWDEVPFRLSVPLPAEPHAHQPRSPPYDAHRCVLEVVVRPWSSPAMLGEGIDATPRGNDERVEELLAPSSPPQPHLPDQEQNQENDAVCNEGAAHDEMRQALSGVVSSAEAERGDASEEELHPCHHRQCLAHYAVCLHYDLPYLSVDALLKVQLQVDAHGDLGDQHEHDVWDELGVDVLGELPALVLVAKEVADDCEDSANRLYGDVPS